MKDQVHEIENFLAAYAAKFNRALAGEPDVEGIAEAFAEHFIEGSPAGVTPGANDESFRKAIAGGLAFYRSIGVRSMEVIASEVQCLDSLHFLVKVFWRSTYVKGEGQQGAIEFDVYYLVQDRGDQKRIFAYITGDEQKVLQELGLVAADMNQRAM